VGSDSEKWQQLQTLKVEYPDVSLDSMGVSTGPAKTLSVPKVYLPSGSDPSKFYTLIMTDPDMPRDPKHKQKEFLHWIVCNWYNR